MSTSIPESMERSERRSGLFWALVPVGILGSALVGLGTLASIAVHDPGFALEKNYYERAVNWDRQRAQEATNAQLGYNVALRVARSGEAAELELELADRAGRALPGAVVTVEAFSNARSGQRQLLSLIAGSDGRYRAGLAWPRPGLWEFRVEVLAEGQRFTQVIRADMPAARHS